MSSSKGLITLKWKKKKRKERCLGMDVTVMGNGRRSHTGRSEDESLCTGVPHEMYNCSEALEEDTNA